jgi:hypothetical protein
MSSIPTKSVMRSFESAIVIAPTVENRMVA